MTETEPRPKAPWLARVIATFFGVGLAPWAPGTCGSVAALVIWAPLVLLDVAWWIRAACVVGVFLVGTWAAERVVRAEGREDPQKVVVDEVAGMGVTLLFAQPLSTSVVTGFLLFRLFDIWKPWPVRVADRKVKGGFGAMLDDVLAGVYALAALELLEQFVLPRFPGVML